MSREAERETERVCFSVKGAEKERRDRMDEGMMVGYEERQAERRNVLKERTAGGEVRGTEWRKMEISN